MQGEEAVTQNISDVSKAQATSISSGPKIFVWIIFLLLSASFIATSAVFAYEFRDDYKWLVLGVYYSHLFIFFPTFGLIALYAFYLPSVVFVDLYWRHIPFGKLRFILGTIIISVLSYWLSSMILSGKLPTIWEIKPQVLAQDQNVPAQCTIHDKNKANSEKPDIICKRLSIYNAVGHVRDISSKSIHLSKFIRNCQYNKMLPEPLSRNEIRHCFANGQRENAQGCCMAQKRLGERLLAFKSNPDNMSLTGKVHRLLLPLKVFFLIFLLVIGAMLVWWTWRDKLDKHYPHYIRPIEKGLLSGVIAMLFWPITNHAFLQSATVLFGYNYHNNSFFASSAPAFSLLFGAWAAMIMLYFLQHRQQKEVELLLKGIGVIISGIAVVKYDLLVDTFVRFAGSGADAYAIIFMLFALVIVLMPLVSRDKEHDKAQEKENFLQGK